VHTVDASERLSANERRKLKSTDLPAQKKVRIDDTELLTQFMNLNRDLEDRTGKYSTQATLEYAIRLAYQRLEYVRSQDDKLSNIAHNI
jgi:hypothetical protein